ncbi:MAG: recombinase family protein [Janthinobacterium lividum]
MVSAPSFRCGRVREAVIKRCAIYTRKSAAERLEVSLNSLDAQRQFCESYIASQAGEGWTTLETCYDDGGFSGGSLDRPAVQRLMADVGAGLVDIVVVYKIDRLSRSLIDFSSLFGKFEASKVDFVAVTQAFNTTSSMGRLTLNVLLSFAQFERELASERLRDKAAAGRAQGLWPNGQRPYGYRLEKGRLTVDPVEAETVRFIFHRYIQTRSSRIVAEELERKGIKNKVGTKFARETIRKVLRNRLYRGNLVYKGALLPGVHEAIITERLWANARKAVEQVVRERKPVVRPNLCNPLRGLLFGAAGCLYMQNAHYNRYGKLYRYYIPCGPDRYRTVINGTMRFKADAIDEAILVAVAPFIPLVHRHKDRGARIEAVRPLIARIDIGENTMTIALQNGAIVVADVVGRVRQTKLWGGRARPAACASDRPVPETSDHDSVCD